MGCAIVQMIFRAPTPSLVKGSISESGRLSGAAALQLWRSDLERIDKGLRDRVLRERETNCKLGVFIDTGRIPYQIIAELENCEKNMINYLHTSTSDPNGGENRRGRVKHPPYKLQVAILLESKRDAGVILREITSNSATVLYYHAKFM
eukprot:334135-Amorphochlora_amoeboformis.AAC.2